MRVYSLPPCAGEADMGGAPLRVGGCEGDAGVFAGATGGGVGVEERRSNNWVNPSPSLRGGVGGAITGSSTGAKGTTGASIGSRGTSMRCGSSTFPKMRVNSPGPGGRDAGALGGIRGVIWGGGGVGAIGAGVGCIAGGGGGGGGACMPPKARVKSPGPDG